MAIKAVTKDILTSYTIVKPFTEAKMLNFEAPGGWGDPAPLTSHDQSIFEKTFVGLTGIEYEPHLVSTHVADGINYAYYGGVKTTTNPSQTGFVIAEVHESFNGTVSRTNVTTYGMSPQALGSWADIRLLTPHDQAVFEQAVKGFVGVIHTPYLVSNQIVNGTNYRYFCISKTLTQPVNTGISIVSIHEQTPEAEGDVGKIKITNITTFG